MSTTSAEVLRLQGIVESLATRVAAQSELLSRRAERRGENDMQNSKYGWTIEQPQRVVLRTRGQNVAVELTFASGTPLALNLADARFGEILHKKMAADPLLAVLLHHPAALSPEQHAALQRAIEQADADTRKEAEERLAAALRRLAAVAGQHLDAVAAALSMRGRALSVPVEMARVLKTLGTE